eukprot:TRINITY_DN68702_c0_g1_i1.p1 TRINITY_DN68702_c0_g1~~TRINITY_DN68702_c0_g1_i1.p1  ORF type:complete len:415 (-),score=95.11 TRINITY_DN68702_c0_g1_i1:135-1340(-)
MGAKGTKESTPSTTSTKRVALSAAERRCERILDKTLNTTHGLMEHASVFPSEETDQGMLRFVLLGASDQGKRTFQVGLSSIFVGVDDETLEVYESKLKTNIAEGLLSVCAVLMENKIQVLPENTGFFNRIKEWGDPSTMYAIPDFFSSVVGFVNDPAVVSAMRPDLRYTANMFVFETQLSMLQNIQKYELLLSPGLDQFVPDTEDMLKCRSRTTGVSETDMVICRAKCRVVLVGGHRSERKKWVHVFGSNPTLLFFISLADYDRAMYEDRSVNRIVESLDIWETIVTNTYFSKSKFYIVFSKADLFRDKLHYRFPKEDAFENFKFRFSKSDSVHENERNFVEFLKSEITTRTPQERRHQINFSDPLSLLDLGAVHSLMLQIVKSCSSKIDQQGLLWRNNNV